VLQEVKFSKPNDYTTGSPIGAGTVNHSDVGVAQSFAFCVVF
jgi:hypothetical protein